MKTIYCVTGASGHLGNVIVRQLVREQKTVRVLLLENDPAPILSGLAIERIYGNVTKIDSLYPFFAHADDEELIVIHAAGIITIYSKMFPLLRKVNIEGTANMLELAKRYQVKRFVYVSSVHAIKESFGEPIKEVKLFSAKDVKGPYAKTKAIATQMVLDSPLDVVVVHPSGIIGPYETGTGNMNKMIVDYIDKKMPVSAAGGYDFVDVRDVADAIIKATAIGRSHQCYILSNRYFTVRELLSGLAIVLNRKSPKGELSFGFLTMIAPLVELFSKLFRKIPTLTRYSLYTISSGVSFSHDLATKELGYQPRHIMETLKDTVTWIQASREKKPGLKRIYKPFKHLKKADHRVK